MTSQLLNSPEDLDWLFETHLAGEHPNIKRASIASAVITGNEDAPVKIELYADANPDIGAEPVEVIFP